jgi:DNA-binding transcriptional LysR family regulator
MARPDLNLLFVLDVLLAEGSVARAAHRLRLSPSAMSRALARLRRTTGDPLLVRAGRGLAATPRALALRERVAGLVHDAEAVLSPAESLDLDRLGRTFTLRTSEGFVENFGLALLARIGMEAPGVRLHFLPKPDGGGQSLADGPLDLETGVIGKATSADLRTQLLFRDRSVGVVRAGHRLARGRITPARYAAGEHVADYRHGRGAAPVDTALRKLGLSRRVVTIVGGFSTALALARASDMIATVPERHTGNLREGLFSFALPVPTPEIGISMIWHPRLDADPAHRWLRACLREVCAPEGRRDG